MKITSLLFALACCGALACAQTTKAVSAFEERMIQQQKQFLQATVSRDSAAVRRAVAEDFQGIEVNGDFYGKDEVVEAARDGMPEGSRSYDFHVVKLTSDSAVVAYNLILPGGNPRYRHMADTWARIDGPWLLKFRQITPNLWSANDLD